MTDQIPTVYHSDTLVFIKSYGDLSLAAAELHAMRQMRHVTRLETAQWLKNSLLQHPDGFEFMAVSKADAQHIVQRLRHATVRCEIKSLDKL